MRKVVAYVIQINVMNELLLKGLVSVEFSAMVEKIAKENGATKMAMGSTVFIIDGKEYNKTEYEELCYKLLSETR